MIRNICVKLSSKTNWFSILVQKKTFLTNDYSCTDVWNTQTSSPILSKVNLSDFYNRLDQNHSSKGIISPIDVDIFANAIKDSTYLEELKDLLHRLRLSSETINTLQSTHHATIRNFIQFGNVQDLLDLLRDPLNYGIFLDDFTANMLMDKLLTSNSYEEAANVAALVMLQEESTNNITHALCQYACYKYISTVGFSTAPKVTQPTDEKPKKVEEIKIRVKYLRNPYFDDHFDIKDTYLLAGKTLAWLSEAKNDFLSINIQVLGLLAYKKYDKLLEICKTISKIESARFSHEVIEFLKNASEGADADTKVILDKCLSAVKNVEIVDTSIEKSLEILIENAINKRQPQDILQQQQLYNLWEKTREEKLVEQTQRLDRAKRIQLVQEKQKQLQEEEQKLWFFENEEKIDLEIEKKEKLTDKPTTKKAAVSKSDEDYIPPEIIPKRR